MRILVVDDSEDWRDLTEAALLAAGYRQVGTADSAAAAFTQLGIDDEASEDSEPEFDLIVLDVVMPKIDGIEACARIRSDSRYLDVPVIMVTALHDMESLSSAFVAGATDYITKPFNRVELLARSRSALKIKAELDRRKARERELTTMGQQTWGERNTSRWIDPATGLLAGPAAEGYLSAGRCRTNVTSVMAIAVDRLDAMTAACGTEARRTVLARVTETLGYVAAPLASMPAIYPDGTIVIVAPQLDARAARMIGEGLLSAVAALDIANPEGIVAERVTISIGALTASGGDAAAIADARRILGKAAAVGGNRIVAVDRLSGHGSY